MPAMLPGFPLRTGNRPSALRAKPLKRRRFFCFLSFNFCAFASISLRFRFITFNLICSPTSPNSFFSWIEVFPSELCDWINVDLRAKLSRVGLQHRFLIRLSDLG